MWYQRNIKKANASELSETLVGVFTIKESLKSEYQANIEKHDAL